MSQQLLGFRELFNSISERKTDKGKEDFEKNGGEVGHGHVRVLPESDAGLEESLIWAQGVADVALHGGNDCEEEGAREISVVKEAGRVVLSKFSEAVVAEDAIVVFSGGVAAGDTTLEEQLGRVTGTHACSPWDDAVVDDGLQVSGEQNLMGDGIRYMKYDGSKFNMTFLYPTLSRFVCWYGFGGYWEEQAATLFAQHLWKMFCSLVPYTTCPMVQQDVFSLNKSGSQLLLGSSLDLDHGEGQAGERLLRDLELPKSGSSLSLRDIPDVFQESCVGGIESGVSSKRRRGRPKKILTVECCSQASSSAYAEGSASLHCEGGPSGGYFTRAKKAWLLGKVLGLEFPGSDLDAISGLEEEFRG